MKVTTSRRDLLELLGKLSVAIPARTYLPVLNHFLVKADRNQIVVVATDLEVQLSGKCKAKVSEPGDLLLPVNALNFLKASTAEKVTVTGHREGKKVKEPARKEWDNDKREYVEVTKPKTKIVYSYSVDLEAGNSKTTIPSLSPEDYIPVKEVKGASVQFSGLLKAIKVVAYAVAKEDTRPVLQCISLKQAKKGSAELAAADGFRLAVSTVMVKGKVQDQFLLAPETVKVMQKLFGENIVMTAEGKKEDRALARQDPNSPDGFAHEVTTTWWLRFACNGLDLVTMSRQGTYPDYVQLIPKKGSPLKVLTASLKEAVRMAMSMGAENGIVRLQTVKAGLSVTGRENGTETKSVIPAQGKAKIAFHGGYLTDLCNQADKTIELRLNGPRTPGVVKNNGTVHVIMPMFVQW